MPIDGYGYRDSLYNTSVTGHVVRPAEPKGHYHMARVWRRCGECDKILPTDHPSTKLYCKAQCARKAARKRDKERKSQ